MYNEEVLCAYPLRGDMRMVLLFGLSFLFFLSMI